MRPENRNLVRIAEVTRGFTDYYHKREMDEILNASARRYGSSSQQTGRGGVDGSKVGNHPDAKCSLHPHLHHSNRECKSVNHALKLKAAKQVAFLDVVGEHDYDPYEEYDYAHAPAMPYMPAVAHAQVSRDTSMEQKLRQLEAEVAQLRASAKAVSNDRGRVTATAQANSGPDLTRKPSKANAPTSAQTRFNAAPKPKCKTCNMHTAERPCWIERPDKADPAWTLPATVQPHLRALYLQNC
jgi:hypothetical protein